MTYEQMIRRYAAGERKCAVCGEQLPAHETWPGAKFPFCGKPECAAILRDSKRGRYIGSNEHKCEAPNCDKFVPEGRYDLRADYLTCCGECWIRRRTKGNRLLTCGCGCGQQFLGRAERKPINGLYFLSSTHYGAYQREQYLLACAGALLPIVREYLKGFAALHYSELSTLRHHLLPFFEYLKLKGITSLEDVTSKTITEFLGWAKENGRRSLADSPSFIATFFKWATACGYRNAGNPVVSLVHRAPKQWRMPRPLDAERTALMWKWLDERGNARLRLVAAIALEAGLRLGEICRMRQGDVDLVRHRIFVRLPNKGKRERYAFFGELTRRYFAEWMAERSPRDARDKHLLHNTRGLPCSVAALGQEFTRVLCKTFHGKQVNPDGFERWSTHALRHTMASNLVSAGADAATVMAAGGWKTYEAMCGYARVDAEVARRGYEEAMKRAREQKQQGAPRKNPLSVAEFLARKRKTA